MGAKIKFLNTRNDNGEMCADIFVQSQNKLKGINCPTNLNSSAIDEFLIIFLVAAKSKGISYFKNITSFTTIDIPNQPNAISGENLKEKFKNIPNVQYKKSIKEAIQSISFEEDDLLIVTGSLYLSGEFLNLN